VPLNPSTDLLDASRFRLRIGPKPWTLGGP